MSGAASNAGRVGVWGASGSGKSSYAKRLIRGARRVVIFDPLDEYTGTTRVETIDGVRLAMRRNWAGFRISYVPRAGNEPQKLSSLCKLLMFAQEPYRRGTMKLGLTLVVEEMNMTFPVSGGANKSPGFAEVCSRGRHYGIHVIGLSQRIAEVATRFRGNCTETVVFRQQGQRDMQAAAQELGCSPSDLPRENLSYLHHRAGQITPGQIKFPIPKKSRKSNVTI